jgi:hypothetical protein
MTGLSICVGGWLVLNAVVFAALMLRRNRPALKDRLFRWVVDKGVGAPVSAHTPSHDDSRLDAETKTSLLEIS